MPIEIDPRVAASEPTATEFAPPTPEVEAPVPIEGEVAEALPTDVEPPEDILSTFSADEIADLAINQPDTFNFTELLKDRPDLRSNPEQMAKMTEAYKKIRSAPWHKGLPGPEKVAGTVKDIAKSFWANFKNIVGTAGEAVALGAVKAGYGDVSPEVQAEAWRDIQKKTAEEWAAMEGGLTGLVRTGAHIAESPTGKAAQALSKPVLSTLFDAARGKPVVGIHEETPVESELKLQEALAQADQSVEIRKGKGSLLQAVGGEVLKDLEKHGQALDPEKVAELEAADPLTWYTFGKAMQPLHAASAAAAQIAPSLDELVGKSVEKIAAGAKPLAKAVVPPATAAAGSIAGHAIPGVGAIPGVATVGGAIYGWRAGKGFAQSISGVADIAKQVGSEIAGTPSGPYTALAKGALQAAPQVLRPLAEGTAMDLGLAAAAPTPSERQGVGLGAAFGLLGAVKAAPGAAWKVLGNQLIGPRSYTANSQIPSSGRYSALDAAHADAFGKMGTEQRGLLNSLRFLLKGANAEADLFAVSADEAIVKDLKGAGLSDKQAKTLAEDFAVAKALADAGVPADAAQAYSQQRAATIKMPDGRSVAVVRASDASPAAHETRHIFEKVLGEPFMREFDQEVIDRYGVEAITEAGQRYGRQVGGGGNWMENILNSTGRGERVAVMKLIEQRIDLTNQERAARGEPPLLPSEIKENADRLLVSRAKFRAEVAGRMKQQKLTRKEAVLEIAKRYRSEQGAEGLSNEQLADALNNLARSWDQILTPEEQHAEAVSYMAREIGAENFAAWFNRTGPDLTTGGAVPDKMAEWIASGMDAVGVNPLRGEVSTGSVPVQLDFGVAKQTGEQAARLSGKRPVIEPEAPRTPARESSDAVAQGREVAAGAPEETLPGATQSIKEMLGTLVQAMADKIAVVINYRSAPGQPAAGSTVEGLAQGMTREARRAIVEAWRDMPTSARGLVERVFSPERVRNTSKGYQVYGLAPQVVAANAQKLAEYALNHSSLKLPPEYTLDRTRRTFTPEGWNAILSDVANYSQNHSRGYTGSGERLNVPGSVSGKDYFAPPVTGEATPIPQGRADVVAALFGYHTPENATIVKAGKLPLNIAGQRVSAETMPGRLGGKKAEFGAPEQSVEQQKRAAELGITGEGIRELNPFLEELNKRQGAPEFIEAKQWMNLEHMADVTPAPDQARLEQNTLTAAAGFMPKAGADRYEARTESGKRAQSKGFYYKANQFENFRYLRVYNEAGAEVGKMRYELDPDTKTAHVIESFVEPDFQRQGLGESLYREMARDIQEQGYTSVQGELVSDVPGHIRQKVFGGELFGEGDRAVSPVSPEAVFMAKTEAGKDLEKRGFTLSRVKEPVTNVMRYEVTPEGDPDSVATLEVYKSKPDTAHVALVQTSDAYKGKGLAETLYRELATDLQEQGVTKLTGDIVHPAPLRIRNSLFGNTKTTFGQLPGIVRVENEIAPGVQFMSKRDEPRAIEAAAVRDEETGKVYSGSWHGEAQLNWYRDKNPDSEISDMDVIDAVYGTPNKKLTDGFVTNEGEFLGRRESYERAKELKQIKDYDEAAGKVLETDSFEQSRQFMPKAESGKELEKRGLSLGRVENEIAPGVQFMPRPGEPKAIKSPAVRDRETGKDYLGSWHVEARNEWAIDKGMLTREQLEKGTYDENLDLYTDAIGQKLVDGFVTNEGEFLNREQAYERATALKQIDESNYVENHYGTEGHLESQRFDRARSFMPKFQRKLEDKALLPEEAGYGSFWLSPAGEFFRVGNHGEWASARTAFTPEELKKLTALHFGDEIIRPGRTGRVAEEHLKEQGWVRISRNRMDEGDEVFVNGTRANEKQKSAMAVWAKENHGVRITDVNNLFEVFESRDANYMPKEDEVTAAARRAGYTVRAGHATPYTFTKFDRSMISDHDPDTNIRGFHFSTEPSEFAAYVSGSAKRGTRGKTKIMDSHLKLGRVIDRPEAEKLVRQQLKRDNWEPTSENTFPEGYDTIMFRKGWEYTPEKQSQYDKTGEVKEGDYVVRHNPEYNSADLYYRGEHLTGYEDLKDAYNQHSESHYVVKNPEQIKSANPKTFNDAGEEIPLSERFSPKSDDVRFMARKSKDEYKLKETPGLYSKAWILPNGRPVQLGGQWHHEWVNENKAAAAKFGLKPTTSGEANRVDALKKGFARVNYGKNRGDLTVEARYADWPKLKDSVLEFVKANIGKIDSMDVHLLDKNAKKVVESDGVNLFSYDANEKLDHIPLITEKTAPTVSMSAQASSEGSYMTKMTDPALAKDVEKVREGTFEGQTYNADGTAWNPGESKNDIVTLASKNFKQDELTTAAVQEYLKPYDELLDDPGIKMGMFPFEQDGVKMVSVDVNAVVPQEHRDNSVAFAKANDQVAIFDAVKFENVPTGGKGNTKLSKPGELLDAARAITKGEPVNVEEVIRQNKEAAPEVEQETLPGVTAPRKAFSTAQVAEMTKAEIAAHFPESVIPKKVDAAIQSDIKGSPLYKGAKNHAAAVKAFATELVKFARQYEKEPAYQDGLRWYSEFTPLLHKVYGKSAQLMAELLAATSPNTLPNQNFAMANEAVVLFNKGAFKTQIAKFEEGLDMIKSNTWRPWLDAEAAAGKIKLPAKVTAATFINHWYDAQNIAPRKSNGKLFGMNSQAVMKVYARQWLQNTEGPKTQNFVQNLLGTGHEATIDVWADRAMRRIGYSGFKPRWRILPKNATGVSDPDFYFGQEAFRMAAEELGILPDALQGALWFAEKKLWADNGWGRLDLGSYQKEFEKVPRLNTKIEGNLTPKAPEATPQGDLFVEPRNVKQ